VWKAISSSNSCSIVLSRANIVVAGRSIVLGRRHGGNAKRRHEQAVSGVADTQMMTMMRCSCDGLFSKVGVSAIDEDTNEHETNREHVPIPHITIVMKSHHCSKDDYPSTYRTDDHV
jgi:hypothetical protein